MGSDIDGCVGYVGALNNWGLCKGKQITMHLHHEQAPNYFNQGTQYVGLHVRRACRVLLRLPCSTYLYEIENLKKNQHYGQSKIYPLCPTLIYLITTDAE